MINKNSQENSIQQIDQSQQVFSYTKPSEYCSSTSKKWMKYENLKAFDEEVSSRPQKLAEFVQFITTVDQQGTQLTQELVMKFFKFFGYINPEIQNGTDSWLIRYKKNPDPQNLREITFELEYLQDAFNQHILVQKVYFNDLLLTADNMDEDVYLLELCQYIKSFPVTVELDDKRRFLFVYTHVLDFSQQILWDMLQALDKLIIFVLFFYDHQTKIYYCLQRDFNEVSKEFTTIFTKIKTEMDGYNSKFLAKFATNQFKYNAINWCQEDNKIEPEKF